MTGNTKSNKDGQDEAHDDDGEGQSRKKSSSKNVDDRAGSSCSTGGGGSTSEEGQSSSRGGGGGYSADCSASDQSSDDAGGGGAIQLSIEQLTLNGGQEDTDSSWRSSPTNEDDDSDEQSQQLQPVYAAAKKHGTHAHHHSRRRHPSKKGAGARKIEVDAAGEGQASSHHHHHLLANKKPAANTDSLLLPPAKSPYRVDIDAILNSKTRSENENAAADMMQLLHGQKFLPQWRGVRVAHPMDPRIDLSSVSVLPGDAVPVAASCGALHTTIGKVLTQMQKTAAAAAAATSAGGASSANEAAAAAAAESSVHHCHQVVEAEPVSVDSYVHLMEVIRPFFHDNGIPLEPQPAEVVADPAEAAAGAASSCMMQPPRQQQQHQLHDSDKTHADSSSEGFTSFFSTTNSGTQSRGDGTNSGSGSSSGQEKRKAAVPASAAGPLAAAAQEGLGDEEPEVLRDANMQGEEEDDSSSMAVLARVRRKHRQPDAAAAAEGSRNATPSSPGSGVRRVRIQEGAAVEAAAVAGGVAVGLSVAAAAAAAAEAAAQQNEEGLDEDPDTGDGTDPSSSSSSSNEGRNAQDVDGGGGLGRLDVPTRIVTDVSSSNRTDSGSNNNTTSGSGSAGNTGSGSGSNGSGNEGKGSSEDQPAQEDNSGENPLDGSDQSEQQAKAGAHASAQQGLQNEGDQVMYVGNNEAAREGRLQDKKRKRIEMRRDYEAQQHLESSESSDPRFECLLRPGKPVTLDQVLRFSKIPRIVIQGTPPFLAVHTNAAYCRLTGNDSHVVVGKPISTLLSLPDKTANAAVAAAAIAAAEEDADAQSTAGTAMSMQAGYQNRPAGQMLPPLPPVATRQDPRELCLERLVAASGFGRLQLIQVDSKQHQMVGRSVSFLKAPPPSSENPSASVSGSNDHHEHQSSNDSNVARMPNNGNGYTGGQQQQQQTRRITCRASIAPVVSSQAAFDSYAMVTDKESADIHKSAKRRKPMHGGGVGGCHSNDPESNGAGGGSCVTKEHYRKHQLHRQLVTHYVIQLEPEDLSKDGRVGSLSSTSTSVEARLLGLTKVELHRLRRASEAQLPPPPEEGVDTEMQAEYEAEQSESTSTTTEEPITTIG